ncbi:cell filamentation protein Fic (plasmid) [Methylobacterium sp. DM1]|uniref:Fic/DOC family protein n=1 Tax=Methylobacterium brachiatum TaxID=269660 RepID=UPI000D5A22C9|nr:Fic family protein [Methylobacterium brachiatum]AWI92064.1 cell filamentation protein Fic [Methylobacterium sp. DM1]AYO86408.1 cell filamentation protein Fic [Methylobacterium brachiatum]
MSEDPYVYEGTDVLRNTADLRNPQILAQREQIVSFRALLQMQKEPVLGTFDLAHYAAIHKRLFGEIYPWAGETRTIETWKPEIVLQGKCVVYSPPAAIEGHARSALDRLRQPPGDLKQDRPTIVYAQAFAALWQAHPFREGNTRTLLAFMEQHARHHRQPLDQGLINRVPSETRDALVLATRGTIRPLAEMIQNARYAEEMRAHPVLGRLSADAVEALRLMGAPRIVLPEPGTQIRGQVIATSYHHALIRDSRQVSAVALQAFHTLPRNNDRVDVRVLPEGRRPEPEPPREEVRAQVTGRVLIPASFLVLNGQRPEEAGRNAIEIPGPSEALSEALEIRSPGEIAADPRLAAEVRLIDRSLIARFGHEGSGVLIEGLSSEARKLLPQGQSLEEIRAVLKPLLKAVLADDKLQTSLAQQQTLGREEPSLGRSA